MHFLKCSFNDITHLLKNFLTPYNLMDCSMPGFPVLHNLLEFTQIVSIELVMSSNTLVLCHPFSCPQSFPASASFPKMALHIRWPGYRRFSFSIRPSNEYSGLVFFRTDWLDPLAVQGILEFSSTTIQKHKFFHAQPSLWTSSHIFT